MMSNVAGAGPCYQPYTDSIGSMPLPKYTLDYSAYGQQDLPNARQIFAHGALLHQSSKWEREQELCGNYLATQLCKNAQAISDMSSNPVANPSLASITSGSNDMNLSELQQGSLHYKYFATDSYKGTPSGSDASSCCNPSVAYITSGFYDMTMTDSSAYQHTLCANPQVGADESYQYDHTNATQSFRQVEVNTDISTQGCLAPSILESSPPPQRRSQRRAPRGASTSSNRHLSLSSEPHQPELLTYKRRNVQVPSELATTPSAHPTVPTRTNRWRCPFCPYVQHNRRSPDLKRHIATRTRRPEEEAQWGAVACPSSMRTHRAYPRTSSMSRRCSSTRGCLWSAGAKRRSAGGMR
ncbi:hypothetical protein C8Q74DRAFT_246352 [Fomes fomentarius]|nr:hypothetical protein C8Q74DRAFT_246352 [Fomes fomentarius]